MPEEAKTDQGMQGQQEQQGKEPSGQSANQASGSEAKVELSGAQYEAILDHIAALETKLMDTGTGKKEVATLDELIEEGQGGQPKAPPQGARGKPIEEMAPQEVLNMIAGMIHQNYIAPLETKVETLRIMQEIDKVAAKAGNEDFWDYAQEVKAIAIKNPTLSIQQAYRLAKTEGTRKPKAEGDTGLSKKSDLLFTLPKRPSIAGGEKPGASSTGMRGATPISRRDAAREAFDAVMGGKHKE